MKKYLFIISITCGLAVLFYPTTSNSNSTGSPGGKTGSIGDNGETCANCHYAGTGNGAAITSNIPSSGYVPGETYTITATVEEIGRSKFGFEITSEDNTGNKKGSFLATNSTETKTIINSTAITHKVGGNTGTNLKIWEFDWIAPGFAASTGSVIFYGSFLGANGDGTNSGDTYHSTTLTINEGIVNDISDLSEKTDFTFNSVNKTIESQISISIYDINGRLVLKTQDNVTNISHLNSGTYILKSNKKRQKILIE